MQRHTPTHFGEKKANDTYLQILDQTEKYIQQHFEDKPFLISIKEKEFAKALRQASAAGRTQLIKITLDYLKSVNILPDYINTQSTNGNTALHWAALATEKSNDVSLLQLLLTCNPDTTIRNKENKLYSDYLSQQYKEKLIKISLNIMPFEYIIQPNNQQKILAKISVYKNILTLHFSDWADKQKEYFSLNVINSVFSFIHQDDKIHSLLHVDQIKTEKFHHHVKYTLITILEFNDIKSIINYFSSFFKKLLDTIAPHACWLDEQDWKKLQHKYEDYFKKTYLTSNANHAKNRDDYFKPIYQKISELIKNGSELLRKDKNNAKQALEFFQKAFDALTEAEPQSEAEYRNIKDRSASLNLNMGIAYEYLKNYNLAYEAYYQSYQLRQSLYGDNNELTKTALKSAHGVKEAAINQPTFTLT